MPEQATTAVAGSETTPMETSPSSDATASTATAEGVTAGGTQERPLQDSSSAASDDLNVQVNLDEVPKEFRSHVEKLVKKYEHDFKSAYTRKTQERSSEVKAARLQAEQAQRQLQQTYAEIQDALKNPAKLDAYKALLQRNEPQPTKFDPKNIPKEIQTVEQLVEYVNTMIDSKVTSAAQQVQGQTAQQLQYEKALNRWEGALNEMRADPKFKKYEKLIVTSVNTEPKYKGMYFGNNEKALLDAAFNDFKAALREDLEEVKTKTQQELTKKAAVTTTTPKKSVPSVPNPGLDKNDIIERVRARLGTM